MRIARPTSASNRVLGLILPAALLALVAGCGQETVEQSQSRRLTDLQNQSYSKEQLKGQSNSDPNIQPYNGGMEGTPVAPGGGHDDYALPIDP